MTLIHLKELSREIVQSWSTYSSPLLGNWLQRFVFGTRMNTTHGLQWDSLVHRATVTTRRGFTLIRGLEALPIVGSNESSNSRMRLGYLDVSESSGTPKSSILNQNNWVFHHKPSILGYPYFWKHPFLKIWLVQWGFAQQHLKCWRKCMIFKSPGVFFREAHVSDMHPGFPCRLSNASI